MCQCHLLATNSFLPDGRVFGTWDFKWPRGATIDVCFQALPPQHLGDLAGMGAAPAGFALSAAETDLVKQGKDEFGKLTRVVECLARRWLHRGDANVAFRFHHDAVLPPPAANNSRSVLPPNHQLVPYDVLVSLAPLPQFRPPHADWRNQTPIKFFLPGSELGRYAQRPDYGVPTTYLGKREQLDGKHSDYFVSKEFWNWCVHEFGHVLGLPHEHQNPRIHEALMAKLRTPGQITEVLQTALGNRQDVTVAEIQDEITTAWPAVRDGADILYSDFRTYKNGELPDDRSSVMLHIYWQRLLQDSAGTEDANFQERPTRSDLDHLRDMYTYKRQSA